MSFVVLFVVGGFLLFSALGALFEHAGGPGQPLIFEPLRRGDLRITVTERGNLESQSEVKILCEVDDIEGDGIHGTPILWIVPNGSSVKKGDLLVELDVSNHQERLDRQILGTERARAEQIKARVQYENQQTQNETKLAEAQLKVELAKLALKQYEDEDGGTFQIDLQDVELQIQEAQASRLIEQTNYEGVEQLFKLGYRSRGELDQARLNALRAERQLATAVSRKKELVEYQYRKTKLELEGQLASAERALQQVKRDNAALLEQARAATEAADEALKKEKERLARYEEQVAKGKIYAPADGMVAYVMAQSRWYRQEIRVGSPVRPQLPILSLPNLKRMQVKTAVHESVLDQVHPGLPVTIRVDAFPDRVYHGSVLSVAVLPDQDSWMGSDTKVYETIVTIDEEVGQIKPGMTAVVEIHVDLLKDVLSVPVQALVQVEEETWCYVERDGDLIRCPVKTGRTNEKSVEIREGLLEGDLVVQNPMLLIESAEAGGGEEDGAPSGEDKGPSGGDGVAGLEAETEAEAASPGSEESSLRLSDPPDQTRDDASPGSDSSLDASSRRAVNESGTRPARRTETTSRPRTSPSDSRSQ